MSPGTIWEHLKKSKRGNYLIFKQLPLLWYPEPGSNRHGLLHWCLRPARLPIPPSGQIVVNKVSLRTFESANVVLFCQIIK